MGAVNTFRLLMEARKNQWLKPSDLEELQTKRLRAIIKHAYDNTDFYHRKFKGAGIRPEDIRTADDLKKIPFTTKSEVREHSTGSMLANGVDLKNCIIAKTSGSTGRPTKIVYDSYANDFSKAINLRSHFENGLNPWSKWAIFGDPSHFDNVTWFQKCGILSPKLISIFDPLEKQIKFLQEFKPDVLGGFTSCLYLLSREIEKKGIEGIAPKVVISTSELLNPAMRDYINSVLNVKMVDHFGCVELNRTAWECSEHAGYHIDSDAVVMEFIQDGENVSAGERGEIVYTGLYNYAMPLIRYNIEDVGVPSDELCPCGRGLPLMKLIEGRSDSFMQTPDGRKFSPRKLTLILKQIPGIDKFKAIQERKDLIRLLIVMDDDFTVPVFEKIRHELDDALGKGVHVEIEIVEDIPREKSGKVRCAVSKVSIK